MNSYFEWKKLKLFVFVNVEIDHYNRLRYFTLLLCSNLLHWKSADLTHRCDFLEYIVHLSLRVQCWIIIERIKERKVLTRFEHATCYITCKPLDYLFIYLFGLQTDICNAKWFKKKSWSKLYI